MDFVYSFSSDLGCSTRSPISRHTGCLTCKRRRKKCDEQKPRCENCRRLNLECETPDLFRASRLSRSYTRRHLKATPGLPNSDYQVPTSSPKAGTRSSSVGANEDTVLEPTGTGCKPSHFFMNIPGCIIPSPSTQLPPIEDYLMKHYVEKLSTILINIDGPINSLRSISFPRIVASSMVTNALYATSACHLSICERKAEYQMVSIKYYNRASSALRHLISDLGPSLSVEQRELMLLTSIFLCKYEIISGEPKNWRPHLRGLQKMFNISRHIKNNISEEMVSYIQSFVAYHWYISGVTRTEVFSFSSEDTDSDEEIEGQLILNNHIDPYMGLSGRFISVLNSLAQIIMSDFTDDIDMDTILRAAMKTVQMIQSDPRDLKFLKLPCGMAPEMSAHLGHIASGYRHTLVVYLHIILERLMQTHGSDARDLQILMIRSLLPCSKQEAISACLEDVLRVPENSLAFIGSSPLVFIVASETKDSSEFEISLQLLLRLWTRTCLGNIGVALDFLRYIQHANFPDWRQALKSRKWDLIVS